MPAIRPKKIGLKLANVVIFAYRYLSIHIYDKCVRGIMHALQMNANHVLFDSRSWLAIKIRMKKSEISAHLVSTPRGVKAHSRVTR